MPTLTQIGAEASLVIEVRVKSAAMAVNAPRKKNGAAVRAVELWIRRPRRVALRVAVTKVKESHYPQKVSALMKVMDRCYRLQKDPAAALWSENLLKKTKI